MERSPESQPNRTEVAKLFADILAEVVVGSDIATIEPVLQAILENPMMSDRIETDPMAVKLVSGFLISTAMDENLAILGGTLTMYVAENDRPAAEALWRQLNNRSRQWASEAAYDIQGRLDHPIDLQDDPRRRAAQFAYFSDLPEFWL